MWQNVDFRPPSVAIGQKSFLAEESSFSCLLLLLLSTRQRSTRKDKWKWPILRWLADRRLAQRLECASVLLVAGGGSWFLQRVSWTPDRARDDRHPWPLIRSHAAAGILIRLVHTPYSSIESLIAVDRIFIPCHRPFSLSLIQM